MATTKRDTIPRTGGARMLAENATMRLPRGRPTTVVRVERGTVLVTQEGDSHDHVLDPGDEVVFEGDGLVVAWAFTEAVISVRDAALCAPIVRPSAFRGDGLSPSPAHPVRGVVRRTA